jgi:hypothetical protein
MSRQTKVLSLLALLLVPAAAQACSVPVFRYALERWPADYYRVVVFHKGELTEDQKKVTDWLTECVSGEEMEDVVCNADVRVVNLAGEVSDPMKEIWESCKTEELPWLLALYPVFAGIEAPLYAGPLTPVAARDLMDSPARREVVKRIVGGDTGVWILLEGGDKEKDAAAEATLKKHLAEMEEELELPPQPEDMWPPQEGEPEPAEGEGEGEDEPDDDGMKIAFSILRISRKTAAEKGFIEMLLGTEPDLKDEEFRGEPMVFPVFGRGRVLCALVGKGINEENIWDIGAFLCGPCACQVKAQNPGTDMLLAAAWDASIDVAEVPEIELPELSGAYGAPAEEPSPVEEPAGAPEIAELPDISDVAVEKPESGDGGMLDGTLIATGATIALVLLAAVVFFRIRQGS